MNPAIIRSKVVLPQPLGPRRTRNSPSRTSTDTPSTAGLPPNRLLSSCNRSRIIFRSASPSPRRPCMWFLVEIEPARELSCQENDGPGDRQQQNRPGRNRLEPSLVKQDQDQDGQHFPARAIQQRRGGQPP